jgi:hypothetical protein
MEEIKIIILKTWQMNNNKIIQKCPVCNKYYEFSRHLANHKSKTNNEYKTFCSKSCSLTYRQKDVAMGFKGGRFNSRGYILIMSKNHPFNVRGYVFEHRLVMEKYLGRYLNKDEQIHHKNGIRNDNRIENLEITSRKDHPANHGIRIKINNKNFNVNGACSYLKLNPKSIYYRMKKFNLSHQGAFDLFLKVGYLHNRIKKNLSAGA